MSDVTRILSDIEQGDSAAAEQLLPLVYAELRKLAAAKLAHEKPGQTLQATALVHEAYLRLVGGEGKHPADREAEISGGAQKAAVGDQPPDQQNSPPGSSQASLSSWKSRAHFFGAAAEAMRRILVDRARARGSIKRGGRAQRLELFDRPAATDALRVDDLLDLDGALRKLKLVDPVAVRLVELRVFAGQSVEDAAAMLNLSASTAKRTWSYARAWLRREVAGERESDPSS
jgi:DNA-directed RNA polymerase specialized sigma24 family protein